MPTYDVNLSRVYRVRIKARNRNTAKRMVEYFLGDPTDASKEDNKARKRFKFRIEEIEMVCNDATSADIAQE